jgi:hypothetical protein
MNGIPKSNWNSKHGGCRACKTGANRMNSKQASLLTGAFWTALAMLVFMPARALADDNDPPTRAARLAYTQGAVSFQPAGTDDWVSAVVNRPMTTGDKLWSDADGRVEVQLDGSLLRLSNNAAMSFLNLSDNVTQVELSAGTLLVRVRRLEDTDAYEIDTPNLAYTILRPGLYRISVDPAGGSTAIRVRAGAGEVTGGGTSYALQANENAVFSGSDQLIENAQQYDSSEDPFDAWSTSRDTRSERSVSSRYVSPDVVGYEDLDDQGAWRPAPGYGNVWFPRTAGADWAPYHNGHWAYIEPWGYSWVDDQPWGFAPFHYGRWVSVSGAWGWVPSPPRVEGVAYVRPVYAPALVAWVGVGAGVAWFALGPRDVYVPSYPVSRNYVNNINVSNTTVNTTVVNNYYNTTVINKTVNVTNVKYVNQGVPGAVAATTSQAFSSAQPVARNAVKVDAHALAVAQVRTYTPAIIPAKQAVLGAGRVAAAKPPAAVQSRAVVAKKAPPAPAPTFEKRQEAIKNNGGKPLSVAQIRQIQPAAQQRAATVKIAPPAKPAKPATAQNPQSGAVPKSSATTLTSKTPPAEPKKAAPAQLKTPTAPAAAKPESRPEERPAAAGNTVRPPGAAVTPKSAAPQQSHAPEGPPATSNAATKPAATVAHPGSVAPAVKSPSAGAANAQLELKHQQEQEQLRVKQDQERQKVQQQQDLERKQLAQQKQDQAKNQQLDQQHQQQAKELQQKHAQEQQELQQKQLKEKQQEASKTPPKSSKDDHPTQQQP